MQNSFIFFEFDASLFKKYYGTGINTPGIYAIPEDEVEPSNNNQLPEKLPNNQSSDLGDDKNAIEQRDDNQTNITQTIQQQPAIQIPQLSQEEQQAFEKEIQPIKKIYLINKLQKLQKILQDNSFSNDDLNLVLKFGPYLTYNTLRLLSITIINSLKSFISQQQISDQDGGASNNVSNQQI